MNQAYVKAWFFLFGPQRKQDLGNRKLINRVYSSQILPLNLVRFEPIVPKMVNTFTFSKPMTNK